MKNNNVFEIEQKVFLVDVDFLVVIYLQDLKRTDLHLQDSAPFKHSNKEEHVKSSVRQVRERDTMIFIHTEEDDGRSNEEEEYSQDEWESSDTGSAESIVESSKSAQQENKTENHTSQDAKEKQFQQALVSGSPDRREIKEVTIDSLQDTSEQHKKHNLTIELTDPDKSLSFIMGEARRAYVDDEGQLTNHIEEEQLNNELKMFEYKIKHPEKRDTAMNTEIETIELTLRNINRSKIDNKITTMTQTCPSHSNIESAVPLNKCTVSIETQTVHMKNFDTKPSFVRQIYEPKAPRESVFLSNKISDSERGKLFNDPPPILTSSFVPPDHRITAMAEVMPHQNLLEAEIVALSNASTNKDNNLTAGQIALPSVDTLMSADKYFNKTQQLAEKTLLFNSSFEDEHSVTYHRCKNICHNDTQTTESKMHMQATNNCLLHRATQTVPPEEQEHMEDNASGNPFARFLQSNVDCQSDQLAIGKGNVTFTGEIFATEAETHTDIQASAEYISGVVSTSVQSTPCDSLVSSWTSPSHQKLDKVPVKIDRPGQEATYSDELSSHIDV